MPVIPAWCRPRLSYVQACQNEAWHLEVWKKDGTGDRRIIPYRCRSWRCEGDCRRWRASSDFARVEEAVRKRDDWTYCVFTYDQKKWDSQTAMYRAGVHIWSKLRKRLTWEFGKIAYVQTWEQHRSGAPHVNVLIGNSDIANWASYDWRALRREWIRPAAQACGFGKVCWVEPVTSLDMMADYLVKLACELTDADEKGQTPIAAPRHFRRLRASQGLLPPPHKNPDITGVLHRHLPDDGNEGKCCLHADPFADTLTTTAKGRRPRAKGHGKRHA